MRKPPKNKTVYVRVKQLTHEALRDECLRRRMSMQAYVEMMIERALKIRADQERS